LEDQTALLKGTLKVLKTIEGTLRKELKTEGITTQRQSDATKALLDVQPIIKTYNKLITLHENALSERLKGGTNLRPPLSSFKRNK